MTACAHSKQVLAAEVGLEGPDKLLLLLNGRRLDRDDDTIYSLDLHHGDTTIIISKLPTNSTAALKPIARADGDTCSYVQQNRNKEFVGNLLLGFSSAAGHDRHGSVPAHLSPPLNVRGPVASVERRHGYAMLGSALGQLMYERMVQAWQAEIKSLQAQASLIAEEENEKQRAFLKAKQKAAKAAARKERRTKPNVQDLPAVCEDYPSVCPDRNEAPNAGKAPVDSDRFGITQSAVVIAALPPDAAAGNAKKPHRRSRQIVDHVCRSVPAALPAVRHRVAESADTTQKRADAPPAVVGSAVQPAARLEVSSVAGGDHGDHKAPPLPPELCSCARCGSSCVVSSNFCSNCGFALDKTLLSPVSAGSQQPWAMAAMPTFAGTGTFSSALSRSSVPQARSLEAVALSPGSTSYAPHAATMGSWGVQHVYSSSTSVALQPKGSVDMVLPPKDNTDIMLLSPLASLSLQSSGLALGDYGHANIFAAGGYLDSPDPAAARVSHDPVLAQNVFPMPPAHQPRRLPIFAELRSASSS
jgi:hypothetical protein